MIDGPEVRSARVNTNVIESRPVKFYIAADEAIGHILITSLVRGSRPRSPWTSGGADGPPNRVNQSMARRGPRARPRAASPAAHHQHVRRVMLN